MRRNDMIKLEFDDVDEFHKFATKTGKSDREKMRRTVQNLGHFIQNISSGIKSNERAIRDLGTYIVLNSEEFLDTQYGNGSWEKLHQTAKEKMGNKK